MFARVRFLSYSVAYLDEIIPIVTIFGIRGACANIMPGYNISMGAKRNRISITVQ